MKTLLGILGALIFGVPIMILLLFSGGSSCTPAGAVTVLGVPDSVAGYDKTQLTNAAVIVTTAEDLDLPVRAAVIGVMTAMGESSLRNIDYGDNATNPDGTIADSIGLFQQQHWWGSVAERMNPTMSATMFYEKLALVDAWESLEPTIAAHRVQRNSDPRFYTAFYPAAVEVVAALTDTELTDDGVGSCLGPTGNYPAATGTPPGPWGGFSNGLIDAAQLSPVPWSNTTSIYLRGDATNALIALNEAFRSDFGYNLPLNDGYRSFQDQVHAKLIYGANAATPGTSNHGWAMAVDVADRNGYQIGFSDPIYIWLKRYGPTFGWAHPDWAEPGGAGPDEAWHWEFYGVNND